MRASGRYLGNPYASLQLTLGAGGGLLFLGLLMSASTTISASLHTTGDNIWSQLIREIVFLGLSVPVFWLAVRLPPAAYRRLAYPALGLSVILLIGVLIPGVGATINGAHRWIQLGPLTLQPSEFAKLAMLLWGADLLARKESLKTLNSAKHVMVPIVPGFIAMIAVIMLEPDLGTSLCFILILVGLLWMVGLPYRYFALILALVAAGVTAMAVTEPYRLQRLTSFLHPELDPQSHGFQALGGLWALSSGGVFGVGLGRGTLKYGWVPNANTDYVFAVVGEELGLLGTTVVLLLFGLFTYSGMRIAFRSNDPFTRLVASGAAIWIAGQALINMGYVTALLPVTGIPLPFISNGGTSLILTCGVLGMIVSFARHEPAAVQAAQRAAKLGTTARWVRWLRLGTPKTAARAKRAGQPLASPAAAGRATSRPVRPPAAARQPSAHPAGARTRATNDQRTATRAPVPQRLRPTGTEATGRRAR
ncbi:MAG: cell division protein FtsW [Pseudonocardiales bacterium]|nr:cell division protein FtsW [Pseudonocardiales bacterium]